MAALTRDTKSCSVSAHGTVSLARNLRVGRVAAAIRGAAGSGMAGGGTAAREP